MSIGKLHFTLIGIVLFVVTAKAQTQDPVPVHDSLKLASKILGETRTINIWTPPAYYQNVDSFMVLYMPDGGVGEDFLHIANTLAALIEKKTIPPMILVGIENTVRRRDMTGPTTSEEDKKLLPVHGGSANFRAFIKDELFAAINKRYRTKNNRAIIGESLAGLFVVETLLQQPAMFQYYIAFDPSLWWNNHQLASDAETYLQNLPAQSTRFWFAGSDAKDIYKNTRLLEKQLKANQVPQLQWHYADKPKQQHSTIFRAAKEEALEWIFNP